MVKPNKPKKRRNYFWKKTNNPKVELLNEMFEKLSDLEMSKKKVHEILHEQGKFKKKYAAFTQYSKGTYYAFEKNPDLLDAFIRIINEFYKTYQNEKDDGNTNIQRKGRGKITGKSLNHMVNGKWWLYHFNEDHRCISRVSIEFMDGDKVEITNPQDSDEIPSYSGSFYIVQNIIRIRVENHGKEINIFIRNPLAKPSLLLGQYITYNAKLSIITGTVLLDERSDWSISHNEKPMLLLFDNMIDLREVLSDNIIDYFRYKNYNFRKISHNISNQRMLATFLKRKRNSLSHDDEVYYDFDFFISSPIYSINTYTEFEDIRNKIFFIKDAIYEVENNKYTRVKYLGDKIGEEKDFLRIKENEGFDPKEKMHFSDLERSRYHLVFLDNKTISTGIFTEIGYSLRSNKPIIVFYNDKDKLPFLLRKLIHRNLHSYSISFWEYNSFTELKDDIKKHGFEWYLSKFEESEFS